MMGEADTEQWEMIAETYPNRGFKFTPMGVGVGAVLMNHRGNPCGSRVAGGIESGNKRMKSLWSCQKERLNAIVRNTGLL